MTLKTIETSLAPDDPFIDAARAGFWRYHRCWKCDDGRAAQRCPRGGQDHNCEYPRARNVMREELQALVIADRKIRQRMRKGND